MKGRWYVIKTKIRWKGVYGMFWDFVEAAGEIAGAVADYMDNEEYEDSYDDSFLYDDDDFDYDSDF